MTKMRITDEAYLADLIEVGFNDASTLVGHFVSSPREREKRDRTDSKGDRREGQGRKENEWKWRNRRNKNIPPLPFLLQGQQALPNWKCDINDDADTDTNRIHTKINMSPSSKGSKFFPFVVGKRKELKQVIFLESVSIPLNPCHAE